MAEYAADDVVEIAKRWKQIAEQEAPIGNDDLDTATGRDLRILASRHGVKWADDDGDYNVRMAIRAEIARRQEVPAAKLWL
jgi:hypothetical protein